MRVAPAAVVEAAPVAVVPTLDLASETPDVRPGRQRAKAKAAPAPKYPHYPEAACNALYDVWVEKRGPIAYDRFRRETAVLFASATPRWPVEELAGALGLALAVLRHRAVAHRQGYEWDRLTPGGWAGRVVEWVQAYQRTKRDPAHLDRLLDGPRPPAAARAS